MNEDIMRLNNKELVGRALDVLLSGLQDLVIDELHLKYGRDWWSDYIIANRNKYNLPIDAPLKIDDENTSREYLDIPLCYSLIKNERLLPVGYAKDSNKLLYKLKDIRNKRSHYGKPTYDAETAREALDTLIDLDDALDLGCSEKLKSISSLISDENDQLKSVASKPVTQITPGDIPSKSATITPCKIPEPLGYDIRKECMKACSGMYIDEEEYQKKHPGTSRFTVEASFMPRRGAYIVTLDSNMIVDDSTGVIIDEIEYGSDLVHFDGYDKNTRKATLYPSEIVKEALNKTESKILLYSDLKWLVGRTQEFFDLFGGSIAYPPKPEPYASSAFLSEHYIDMTSEQSDAVKLALTSPLSYVWGVPGSGKTQYVLATAINECVRRKDRIAVVAPTNLALEQVLRGLMKAFENDSGCEIDPEKDIIRIGNPTAGFLKDFPSICENQKVQSELMEMMRKRNMYASVLKERRYEALKPSVEEAAKLCGSSELNYSSSEKLYRMIEPLLKEMRDDPRFETSAKRVHVENVKNRILGIRNLIYGGDRSQYLEGDIARYSDKELDNKIKELDTDIEKLRESNPKADINSCKIIAMTLSKFIISYGPEASGRRYPLKVDHVFLDEAGYCNAIQTLSLFSLGAPITMLGDHKQLPPVNEIERKDLLNMIGDPKHGLDFLWQMSALYVDSFFEESTSKLTEQYRYEEEPTFDYTAVANLTVTHRFGQNLADAIGEHIYERKITSGSGGTLDIKVIDAKIDSFPIEYGKPRRKNEAEALAISKFIEIAHPDDYVILTPYKEQRRRLQKMYGIQEDKVLTIHSAQGREWDTVIISVCDGTACDEEKPPRFTSTEWNGGNVGKKVMNTAITRAKKHLILVCDCKYWSGRSNELISDIIKDAPRLEL